MAKSHGNSHNNDKPHHLYQIKDRIDDDVLKYGISADPIDDDGLSERVRSQLNLYNAIVGWVRFFAEILITGIQGRKRAEEIEQEYIGEYEQKHGRKPRANRK